MHKRNVVGWKQSIRSAMPYCGPILSFPGSLANPSVFITTAVVALSSRSAEEASSRGSESKDPKEEAAETRAELTDVEDRSEAGHGRA